MPKGISPKELAANWGGSGKTSEAESGTIHGEVVMPGDEPKIRPMISEEMVNFLVNAGAQQMYQEAHDEGYQHHADDMANAAGPSTIKDAAKHVVHHGIRKPIINAMMNLVDETPVDMSQAPDVLKPKRPGTVEKVAVGVAKKAGRVAVAFIGSVLADSQANKKG